MKYIECHSMSFYFAICNWYQPANKAEISKSFSYFFQVRKIQTITVAYVFNTLKWKQTAFKAPSHTVETVPESVRSIWMVKGKCWDQPWKRKRIIVGLPEQLLTMFSGGRVKIRIVNLKIIYSLSLLSCALVLQGIFWRSSPGIFTRYSGFLPSFIS